MINDLEYSLRHLGWSDHEIKLVYSVPLQHLRDSGVEKLISEVSDRDSRIRTLEGQISNLGRDAEDVEKAHASRVKALEDRIGQVLASLETSAQLIGERNIRIRDLEAGIQRLREGLMSKEASLTQGVVHIGHANEVYHFVRETNSVIEEVVAYAQGLERKLAKARKLLRVPWGTSLVNRVGLGWLRDWRVKRPPCFKKLKSLESWLNKWALEAPYV